MNSLKQTREDAIKLRRQGMSYGMIQRELNISKGTLSYWLKNIPLSRKHREKLYTAKLKNLIRGSQSIRERRRRAVDTIVDNARKEIALSLSTDADRLFGAALYWAEGSKGGAFEITNSDPLLIVFIVRWIERIFHVPPEGLRAWLNIYSQQDEAELKHFWSSLCGIPVARFGKSFIKPASKGFKRNNLYYGTIKVRVPKSTDIKHRIFGWIRGALQESEGQCKVAQKRWEHLRYV